MIVSAFAGTGKTSFTEKYPHVCVDLDSSLFGKDENGNRNANFVDDYVKAIAEHADNFKIVFISTHVEVLDAIAQQLQLPVTIIIPDNKLVDEYMLRYRDRNNNPEFIDKMYESWDSWLDKLKNRPDTAVIVLQSGQYVSDVIRVDENLSQEHRQLNNALMRLSNQYKEV